MIRMQWRWQLQKPRLPPKIKRQQKLRLLRQKQ